MGTEKEAWRDKFEEVEGNIRAWQRTKPRATLTEIGEVVEEELARQRRKLVEDLADESGGKDIEGVIISAQPARRRCIAMGGKGGACAAKKIRSSS